MHIIVTGKAVGHILLFAGGFGCGALFAVFAFGIFSIRKGRQR